MCRRFNYTDMKETINDRVRRLREVMRRERLAAYIFPSTDPHGSEYVPERWEGRKWMTGFDGSAGTAVVTLNSAAVWTDSRYFLAAEQQLRGTEYVLMRERMPGTPTIAQWLAEEIGGSKPTEVGIDGMSTMTSDVESLIMELRENGGLTLRTNFDPLNEIWNGRPEIPTGQVRIHDLRFAGEPCRSKLKRVRAALRSLHADGMLMSSLDDIAWTLNLRGSDVHCNPVFVSYLLLSGSKATLYVDKRKLSGEVVDYLKGEGVGVDEYENVVRGLKDYPEYNILVDADETNYTVFRAASRHHLVRQPSPVKALKAVKNQTEIDGFRKAMVRDGVAMVRFLMWLKPAVVRGGQTELSVTDKLLSFRKAQPNFRDISFDTIAGYEQHGAIVHYEATAETDVPLKPHGFILIDSGAQYDDGTTDITRTVSLGAVTPEQKHIYTLVLKGHLQLQNLKFPDGASGTQIDAVARTAMWSEGINFMHGTGHGVGSYLNVHEGPHQIRMEWRPAPLRAGMTVTDEPGIYLAGRFGVRTENTLLVCDYKETEFGRFLRFSPLTLCPIDKEPIEVPMLSEEERVWLNEYHELVYRELSTHLDEAEKDWLAEACAPI